MKGRKPVPSKIIDIRGGSAYTHKPPRTGEPQPTLGLPPCPRHLAGEARKEWRRASRELLNAGMLAKIDLAVFMAYCQYYARWRETSERVGERGLFITVNKETVTRTLKDGTVIVREKQGEPRISPILRAEQEAFDRMCRCLVEMGMTPSSRARVKTNTAPASAENSRERFFK